MGITISASLRELDPSTLALQISSSIMLENNNVTISGQILPQTANENVTLQAKINSDSWTHSYRGDTGGWAVYVQLGACDWRGNCYSSKLAGEQTVQWRNKRTNERYCVAGILGFVNCCLSFSCGHICDCVCQNNVQKNCTKHSTIRNRAFSPMNASRCQGFQLGINSAFI